MKGDYFIFNQIGVGYGISKNKKKIKLLQFNHFISIWMGEEWIISGWQSTLNRKKRVKKRKWRWCSQPEVFKWAQNIHNNNSLKEKFCCFFFLFTRCSHWRKYRQRKRIVYSRQKSEWIFFPLKCLLSKSLVLFYMDQLIFKWYTSWNIGNGRWNEFLLHFW